MARYTLTFDQLAAHDLCDLTGRAALFREPGEALDVKTALERGASVADILWVAGRLGLRDKVVECAIRFAERVAALNPDPRVRAALDAARACLNAPTPEHKADAARAAAAAAAAADATDAAYAADAAARAADADAAAYAAYAARAARAARAAAAAAYAAAADAAAAAATPAAYAADAAAYAAARAAEQEAQRQIVEEVFS